MMSDNEGHEDYEEEFIHDGEILEELALNPENMDHGSDDDEMEIQPEPTAGNMEQDIPDDSVQGFFGHKEPVYSVDVHPLLPIAVSGGGDDQSMLWNYQSGEQIAILAKHGDSVSFTSFSHDGNFIASGGLDGKVYIFDMQGSTICGLEGPSEVTWLSWHPRGNIIVAGSEDGTIWMWNAQTGQCMNVFTGHSESISCVEFSPDGKFLVSSSLDGSIFVWDPKTAAAKTKWNSADGRFHQAPVTSFAISEDNQTIISGGQDGSVLLLHIATNRILNTLDSHGDSIESISFSKTFI